ncbi:cytochrome c [Hydrotalea sp.]|uniref:c-type cytochrome n=1 Tax=Hydrotalea sp. TaxID=2881279 RepID=UPI0026346C41|nr:cytochrome c [Hydrotalea sp.]
MDTQALTKGIKKNIITAGCFIAAALLLPTLSKAQTSNWNVPASANQLKNPLVGNTSVLKDAKKLYITNCGPCHGNNGKGDGIAAAALKPKPADHTSAAVQKETDGALYWKMTEGHTPMPSYKQALTDSQRWELVNYIRTLAKKR